MWMTFGAAAVWWTVSDWVTATVTPIAGFYGKLGKVTAWLLGE
jgi:hypothetical protein